VVVTNKSSPRSGLSPEFLVISTPGIPIILLQDRSSILTIGLPLKQIHIEINHSPHQNMSANQSLCSLIEKFTGCRVKSESSTYQSTRVLTLLEASRSRTVIDIDNLAGQIPPSSPIRNHQPPNLVFNNFEKMMIALGDHPDASVKFFATVGMSICS